MKNNWQHMKGGNGFADAMMAADTMMNQNKSTSMIGPPGPRYAGIITSLPKREGWQGQAMMGGVPVDPSGYGLTEFDTDKFHGIFGSTKEPTIDQLMDSLGTQNIEQLGDEDYAHAMKGMNHLNKTDLGYDDFETFLAEGRGYAHGYQTITEEGDPKIRIRSEGSPGKKAIVATHEFDHGVDDADRVQYNHSAHGNARFPYSVRPHEIRAFQSGNRSKFDNRFTNPKSPWFIHPSLDVNYGKIGNLFGLLGPNISSDRTEMIQKYSNKVGKESGGPTIDNTYRRNLRKQRDKVQDLWDNDPEFRKALDPLLLNGLKN